MNFRLRRGAGPRSRGNAFRPAGRRGKVGNPDGLRFRNLERVRRSRALPRRFGFRYERRPFRNRPLHRDENRKGLVFDRDPFRLRRIRLVPPGIRGRPFALLYRRRLRRDYRGYERAFDRFFAVRLGQLGAFRHGGALHLGLQLRLRLGRFDFFLQGFRGRRVRDRFQNVRFRGFLVRERSLLRTVNPFVLPGLPGGGFFRHVDVFRSVERERFPDLYRDAFGAGGLRGFDQDGERKGLLRGRDRPRSHGFGELEFPGDGRHPNVFPNFLLYRRGGGRERGGERGGGGVFGGRLRPYRWVLRPEFVQGDQGRLSG